jgi:hypothetical protein
MNKLRLATVAFSLAGLTFCVTVLGASFGVTAVTGSVLIALAAIAAALVPLHFLLHFAWRRLISLPLWSTLGTRIGNLFKKKTV